jgi:ABC-2 type transport system permease protein
VTASRAASSATGSIYDLGYRGYDGPRLGRRHAIRALFAHTLKICYGIGRGGRAKLAPIVLGAFATVPAIVGVGVLALARQLGAPSGVVEDASPIQHSTYFGIIGTLVMLFCAAQVPEVLGRDQRYSLLSLYSWPRFSCSSCFPRRSSSWGWSCPRRTSGRNSGERWRSCRRSWPRPS